MSKQGIYNQLRRAGLTEAGALGMLGNFEAESNCEPNRVQNDNGPYRTVSKDYTARVTDGRISQSVFASDQRGFGLAQWTWGPRKANLHSFWKKSGKALDDPTMQVEFALKELKEDFPRVLSLLTTSTDLYSCTSKICYEFENPDVKNVDTRFRYAKEIKAQLKLNAWQEEEPESEPEPEPAKETYWPPRMVCKGMSGPDIEVLQAILKARGYIITNPDGIFEEYLDQKVREFQTAQGLAADGIAGPLTWGKLLDMGVRK